MNKVDREEGRKGEREEGREGKERTKKERTKKERNREKDIGQDRAEPLSLLSRKVVDKI